MVYTNRMKVLGTLLTAFSQSLPFCLAAGPIALPDIESGASSGRIALPSASTQLPEVLASLSSISNLTALTNIGVG